MLPKIIVHDSMPADQKDFMLKMTYSGRNNTLICTDENQLDPFFTDYADTEYNDWQLPILCTCANN